MGFELKRNTKLMSDADRSATLAKANVESVLDSVIKYIPYDTQMKPNTWALLLRIPESIPNRIYQAALLQDAMMAEALAYQIAERNIINQSIENAKIEAAQSSEPHHRRALLDDGELTAGEYDIDGNGTTFEEDDTNELPVEMGHLSARIAAIYHASFEEARAALGVDDNEPDMTDEELDQWMLDHEGEEYDAMRQHVMNGVNDATLFGLEHMSMTDRFVDRFTVMAMKAGKTLEEVEKLGASLISRVFDSHVNAMTALANDMEAINRSRLINQGMAPPVNPAQASPKPVLAERVNNELRGLNAPTLSQTVEGDISLRLAQVRLAMIQAMHPESHTLLQQKRQFPKPAPDKSSDATLSESELNNEIVQHAKNLNVSVTVLVKATDRTILDGLWGNDPAVKQAMNDNPVVEPQKKPSLMKKAMEASMKPPGAQGV